MKNENEQIHEAAKIFLKTLEKYLGKKAIVFYGVIYDDKERTYTGISLSESLESSDLEHLAFQLVGRAHKLVDY